MAENKFMERLRGKDTAKAVLEIQNTGSKTTFTKIPQSSSDATIVYPDSNHNATAVLKNAINWKVTSTNLDLSNDITGDGDDYVGYGFVQGISDAQGNNLWINSSYTVPAEGMVFTKNTKWILKLCGDNLLENGGTSVDFTVVITLGQSNIISKSFTVREQASFFCKEMVIDFTESNTSAIKLVASDKITLKLLSNSANASARIYLGMTTLTVLQRTVEAETVAFNSTTLEDLADTVSTHIADTNNPHSVTKAQVGLGNCNNTSDLDKPISTATQTALNGKVNIDGTSVMTGPLLMRATDDFKCAIAPYWDGIGFFKLNDNNSVTLMASLEYEDGLTPATDNIYNLGTVTKRWKDARIARVITAVINNGYDIAVPVTNSPQTLALKSEVDLAANSGRMITAQGVWYAKMYGVTVVPSSAEVEGRNYADFSQVDGQGNPIIVIYTYTSGAWDAGTTIVPPADYDGYVPITSKIWDIPEQTGQQGGRILWNHQSKEFTPYPLIVSFDGQNITNSTFSNGIITSSTFSGEATLSGVSTAPDLDVSSPNNQIVNKQSLENALVNHGTGRNVGDTFLTMRNDNELNGAVECDGATYNTTDFTGAQSIGQLLADGKVPYVSLAVYATTIATQGWCDKFGWDGVGTTPFKVPTLNAYIWQTLQEMVCGNGMTLGFRDASDNHFGVNNYPDSTGLYLNSLSYGENLGTGNSTKNGPANTSVGITTDETKSGLEVKTSGNVAEHRVMVQLAVSASDEAVETCTSVLADVAALKYDYVVDFQAPAAENNYTWYRKYKSGWVEQGGIYTITAASFDNFNLVVEMADANYTIVGNSADSTTNAFPLNFNYSGNTATTFQAKTGNASSGKFTWRAEGMAA